MAEQGKEYVHKDVTVVIGNDELVGTGVVFIVKKDGAAVITFPMHMSEIREFNSDDMEKFLSVTPGSQMVEAIARAWREREPQ